MLRHMRRALDRALTGREEGFTVIEVMVAMMVFAIISVGLAYGITNSLQTTQASRGRDMAVSLASQDIDTMRQTAAATTNGIFSVLSASTTKSIGGVTYTVARTANWVQSDGATGACGSSNGTLAYKSVAETVSWNNPHGPGKLSTTVTSAIAPSDAVTDPGDGTIIVSVRDAAGAANAGVSVSAAPVSGGTGAAITTAPTTTDAAGCWYATDVQPGTYTLTASTTGGIDSNQAATSTWTIPVIAGASAYQPISYDQAATIPVNYAQTYSATMATNMTTTLSSNSGGLDTMTPWSTSATVTSSTKVSMNVFPFSDGYQMYGGTFNSSSGASSCIDTNPTKWTTPTSAGAVGTSVPVPVVSVSPGQTVSPPQNVALGVIQVSVASGSYLRATTASRTTADDPGCSAGMTLNFPKTTSSTATLALPFGTWSISTTSGASGAVTGTVAGANIKNVTPGSVTGNTVLVDPRGQTK
ncbi:hypothetical protein DEI92_01655 [Curtobacterium sp. MCBD17_034]|uniref:prepilin-type N-terminal cleavage/methylation domain-containing protein n=1 Tax=unclassified Curtobacterium TaxID=257496 RepID=UPI000DA8E101|nr:MULTISPECIES: prepilin-type N-terminal cleavage/methylation domain-containing protein [unclassified Curtobacterium]PZF62232.1 hypothetical protein DEI92_01655 [Curtobacterium sp. MCBD17_034]PZM40061.1 hypothetical protein DEI90_04450 [Curtobacterium sp. MCBD17_031]